MSSATNQIEMTNIAKKSNSYRLAVLNARYERLVELNQTHHYTTMVLTSEGLRANPKEKKYTRLLKKIYEEKVGIWVFNRKNNKVYLDNLENAKTAIVSMTKNHLFNLTSPVL